MGYSFVNRRLLSNASLCLGVLMLMSFGMLELQGLHAPPLVPAFSAFLIGCTAVLDRLGPESVQ